MLPSTKILKAERGCIGNTAILSIDSGHYKFPYVKGNYLIGDEKINMRSEVLKGQWWQTK
jgi:hypothetical protein